MIHTPNQSEALLTLINTLAPVKFNDCSYKNDECDSIDYTDENNRRMQIFLPNMLDAFAPDNDEEFDTFLIAVEDLQGNNNTIDQQLNLIQVLSILDALNREFKVFIKGEFRTLTTMDWLQAHAELDFDKCIKPMLELPLNEEVFIGDWATERIK